MFICILRTVLYLSAEANSGPSPAPEMDLFARTVNDLILMLLTILVRSFTVEVCRGPEYISDLF